MSQRITVLMGGASNERDVSLRSGAAASQALEQAGYTVTALDVGKDPADIAARITASRPDVVFNALHGRWGEDGCVQAILDMLGIAYTHSGMLASAAAMDKAFARQIFAQAGIPVAQGCVVKRGETTIDPLPRPYVVKPLNEGSSVGVYIVKIGDNGPTPLETWPFEGDTVLVESFIPGRELTVAVMGARALGVLEITSDHGFYDYDAKYAPGGSKHLYPAPIPPADYQEACRLALEAHRVLGCRGVSRTDLRYDDTGPGQSRLVVLEVNTQPGMTATSLVPELAAHQGISFPELVRWMVENARCGL